MWLFVVVEREVALLAGLKSRDTGPVVEVDIADRGYPNVLECLPKPFDEVIVQLSPTNIHTDAHTGVFWTSDESAGGELPA